MEETCEYHIHGIESNLMFNNPERLEITISALDQKQLMLFTDCILQSMIYHFDRPRVQLKVCSQIVAKL